MTPVEGIRAALVTGGGTGIGAAITSRLAQQGYSVLVWQETEDDGRERAAALAAPGLLVRGSGGDLRQPDCCRDAIATCVEIYGGVDVLVNSAAITGAPAIAPFLDCDDQLIDDVVDLNLKACIRCGREAARVMAQNGSGVIVNVSSVAAVASEPAAAAYSASKAAIEGLTRAMALELAPRGIRVVAVSPGDIETPASRGVRLLPDGQRAPQLRWDAPLGIGAPEDVAAAVGFLVSSEARYISGATLVVDGGYLC